MNNLIPLQEYADSCGVSATVIRNRIGKKKIIAEQIKNCYFIDAVKYPPQMAGKAGRPSAKQVLKSVNA